MRTHLMPKILYGTTNSLVPTRVVNELDKSIRISVRRFQSAMIHAGIIDVITDRKEANDK